MRRMVIVALGLIVVVGTSAEAGLHDYRYNPTTQHVYARTDYLTWAGAEAQAVAAGANLATVNDAGENGWIVSTYGGSRWIGFNDAATEGTWVWSSGTGGTWDYPTWSGTSYTHWYNPKDGAPTGSEPNNSGNEDWTEVRSDRYWNDLRSTHTRHGVAEFPATLAVQQHHLNPATGKVYLKTNSTSWENAELLATTLGGHLATIRNAGENEYVAAATRGGWIGYTDRDTEGTFTWVSGDAATYTNWNTNEPNNAGAGEDYAEMQSTGRWNDLGTSHNRQGIVELDATVTEYKHNSTTGHVYARTSSLNWQRAQLVARAAGGELVAINDAAENTWVQNSYSGNNWIGLHDVADQTGQPDPPGDWRWSNGDAVTYTNWGGSEPNGASEDHATIRGDQQWNDWSGQNSTRAIVEFPDAVPSTSLTGRRYNPATNKIYALTSSATWRAAQLVARVNGAHLATVNNAAENAWLAANVGGGWIGFNDDGHEGGWVWSSGEGGAWDHSSWSGTSYTHWNHPNDGGTGGEPNNSGGAENYAEISTTGFWNDLSTQTRRGIVEMNARSPQWRFNPASGKLNALTDSLTWHDAEAQAQVWGGNLATVRGAAENTHLNATFPGYYWIGFNDEGTEGTWVWSSGQGGTFDRATWTGTSYTHWNHPNDGGTGGEPNGGTSESYAAIRSDGLWNDLAPSSYRSGIAEKDATPPRWVYNPANGKFYARTDNLTWEDAELQAQYWSAHLTTINDAAENAFIPAKVGTGWIGFTDKATEGTWVWAAGDGGTFYYATWSGTSYTHWNHPNDGGTGGEPNNSGGAEHYAEIGGGAGFWNDLSTQTRRGIAEIDRDTLLATIERIEDPVTGRKYAILGLMTWEDAEAAAEALGGHLPTARTQHENDFLQGLTAIVGGTIWLGLNDVSVEGVWEWASGFDFPFTSWNTGEPNDAGAGEDYAAMYTNGLWNDVGSTTRYYAVIEFVPEPATCTLLGLGILALARRRRRKP